eukprot:1150706-Pelagomonas_calceolata.AAC.8
MSATANFSSSQVQPGVGTWQGDGSQMFPPCAYLCCCVSATGIRMERSQNRALKEGSVFCTSSLCHLCAMPVKMSAGSGHRKDKKRKEIKTAQAKRLRASRIWALRPQACRVIEGQQPYIYACIRQQMLGPFSAAANIQEHMLSWLHGLTYTQVVHAALVGGLLFNMSLS